jgi:hypothetical protein
MKSIRDTKFKVGDRVKWSGMFYKFINGWDEISFKQHIVENRNKPDFNVSDFVEKNTVPVKRKGINTIKSIEYEKVLGEYYIKLENGKWFFEDTDLMLVDVNEKIKNIIKINNPLAHLCYVTSNGLLYCAEFEDKAFVFLIPINALDIHTAYGKTIESVKIIEYFNTVNKITDN